MTIKLDEKQLEKILEVVKWLGSIFESLVVQLKRLNDNLEKRK